MKLGQITPATIQAGLQHTAKKRAIARDRLGRYGCNENDVPIFSRRYEIGGVEQTDLICRKINYDLFSEVVDMKTGYMYGVPVKVSINKERFVKEKAVMAGRNVLQKIMTKITEAIAKPDVAQEVADSEYQLQRFGTINDIDKQNSEIGTYNAVAGYAGRLHYIGRDKEIHCSTIPPQQCSFFDDASIYTFKVLELENGTTVEKEKGIAYDDVNQYEFDGWVNVKITKTEPHGFTENPFIKSVNNINERGDCDNAIAMIDQFDRTLSDWCSENEQFRLAILAAIGVDVDKGFFEDVKKYGGAKIPTGGDMKYITKILPYEQVLALLKELREGVLYTTKTPDLRPDSNVGTQTGVALDIKMRPFEFKCGDAERHMTSFMRNSYRIIAEAMKKWGLGTIEYSAIDFTLTRNYPHNMLEEAQIQSLLDGKIPDIDRLKLFSAIKDPEQALERLKNQKEDSLNYSFPAADTPADTGTDPNAPETPEKPVIEDKTA